MKIKPSVSNVSKKPLICLFAEEYWRLKNMELEKIDSKLMMTRKCTKTEAGRCLEMVVETIFGFEEGKMTSRKNCSHRDMLKSKLVFSCDHNVIEKVFFISVGMYKVWSSCDCRLAI